MNNIQYTCTFFDHLLSQGVTKHVHACMHMYTYVHVTYVVEGGICTKSSPLRYTYTPHGNIIVSISSPLRDFGTHSTVGVFQLSNTHK